jgi:hypothetical protein
MTGKGTPMTGSSPLTMAVLTTAWPMIQVITLEETMRANVSWVLAMTLKTAMARIVNSPRTISVPARPSSSPRIVDQKARKHQAGQSNRIGSRSARLRAVLRHDYS